MGGFFGMQGPPAVLYFIQSEPTKEHYMAMAQTYFLIGNLMMTGVRAYNGFFTTTVAVDYLYGHQRCNHINDKLRTMAYMNKFTQSDD